MSKAAKSRRESPVYVPMGLDAQMNVRFSRHLRKELETVHAQVYRGGLPGVGLGKFIGFAASLGLDVIRQRYLHAGAKQVTDRRR
jgi:hypothetical protein